MEELLRRRTSGNYATEFDNTQIRYKQLQNVVVEPLHYDNRMLSYEYRVQGSATILEGYRYGTVCYVTRNLLYHQRILHREGVLDS